MLRNRKEQRQLLLQQINFFIDMQAEGQEAVLKNRLPTVEEYRQGTSAVGVCLTVTEYMPYIPHQRFFDLILLTCTQILLRDSTAVKTFGKRSYEIGSGTE